MQRQIVMFAGTDASNNIGLWESNGTVAGTHELTGISGANTGTFNQFSGGVFPSELTVFNGEVLFRGLDAHQEFGLWVTTGSAAGTHEVAGISGSNSANNIQPNDLTVFNDEVLFEGISASDELGLWVTNGTAGGTHEVTGISGAVGILGPSDLTFFRLNIVSNAKVLFSALDASFKLGLWVTDGTSGGRTS